MLASFQHALTELDFMLVQKRLRCLNKIIMTQDVLNASVLFTSQTRKQKTSKKELIIPVTPEKKTNSQSCESLSLYITDSLHPCDV